MRMSVYCSRHGHIVLTPACFTPCSEARQRYGKLDLAGAVSTDGSTGTCRVSQRIHDDVTARGFTEISPRELALLEAG